MVELCDVRARSDGVARIGTASARGTLSGTLSLAAKDGGTVQGMGTASEGGAIAGFQTTMSRTAIQPPTHRSRKRSAGAPRRASPRRAITAPPS
ncbi:hypothetical protein ASE06_02410 [Sphingopyxis sp. Root214]|uniref:hypothetical protein n=1 Tax=Sphingopyxis sp. Root214 TaxID=1736491 RepID=UPI0007136A66|nr:hypothetical protein [Sphingopyxis sp. Root214]KQZ77308.1 hypothetical protein ASD73_05580 [Sphingopyxis sp. Root154]KRC08805.1 hypothetical protein ASE06_02410 [Sphingopyxis sp. Root214]